MIAPASGGGNPAALAVFAERRARVLDRAQVSRLISLPLRRLTLTEHGGRYHVHEQACANGWVNTNRHPDFIADAPAEAERQARSWLADNPPPLAGVDDPATWPLLRLCPCRRDTGRRGRAPADVITPRSLTSERPDHPIEDGRRGAHRR